MTESAFLSVGLVGERPVFMDERHDSYFLLEEDTEAEFLDILQSDGTLAAAAGASLRSVLGIADGPSRIVVARPPQATRSLLDETGPPSRARIRDAVVAARLLRRARCAIATRPIGETLSDLAEETGTRQRETNDTEILRDAWRFIAARRLVPFAPNCLMDSLALFQWLGPSPGALLVFGVKLVPFAAHCWVQFGDLLLNDRLETIAQFRPVRVIECTPATR